MKLLEICALLLSLRKEKPQMSTLISQLFLQWG